MINNQELLILLNEVITDIEEKLTHQQNTTTNLDLGGLENIREELFGLSEILQKKELPKADDRWLNAAAYVLDQWPPDEPLGEKICRLDYLYRHLSVNHNLTEESERLNNLSGEKNTKVNFSKQDNKKSALKNSMQGF